MTIPDLIGSSERFQALLEDVRVVAPAECAVLVQGETGTGKEVIARAIHNSGPRQKGPFVALNCAAIPGALLESELFGYERGAFTGANAAKPGRVESAHGGTLFLDEIADLNLQLQSKLLHFLQDGTFSRIGDTSERRVDTRVICASNKNLSEEIEA